MINAWVTGRCFSSNWVTGSRKASVLPEPVSASYTTESDVLLASRDACCISFNASICRLASEFSIEKEDFCIWQKYINSQAILPDSHKTRTY
jgi:hypothetical protein